MSRLLTQSQAAYKKLEKALNGLTELEKKFYAQRGRSVSVILHKELIRCISQAQHGLNTLKELVLLYEKIDGVEKSVVLEVIRDQFDLFDGYE